MSLDSGSASVGDYSLALVVCTRNRPFLWPRLLQEIRNQTLQPTTFIIVESSDPDLRIPRESIERALKPQMDTTILQSDRASLPVQRNLAIQRLDYRRYDYIAFLDDDTLPAADYFAQLSMWLHQNPHAVGASGVTGRHSRQLLGLAGFYKRFFLLDAARSGEVLPSGFNIPHLGTGTNPTEVQWLFGCSVWRSRIFDNVRFDEALPGSGLFEDAIFSVRARRYGELWVLPLAHLEHSLELEGRADERLEAFRRVKNRTHVILARSPRRLFRWVPFYWSLLGETGLLVRRSSAFFRGRRQQGDLDAWDRLCGHLLGIVSVVCRGPFK